MVQERKKEKFTLDAITNFSFSSGMSSGTVSSCVTPSAIPRMMSKRSSPKSASKLCLNAEQSHIQMCEDVY